MNLSITVYIAMNNKTVITFTTCGPLNGVGDYMEGHLTSQNCYIYKAVGFYAGHE